MNLNQAIIKTAYEYYSSAYPGSPFYIALMFLARHGYLHFEKLSSRMEIDREYGADELLIAILDRAFVDTLSGARIEEWDKNDIVCETLVAYLPNKEISAAISLLFDINSERYSYNPASIFDAAHNLMSIDYSMDENISLFNMEFEIAISRIFGYREIPYEPYLFKLMSSIASIQEGDNICLPYGRAGLFLPLLSYSKTGFHMTMESNPVYRSVATLEACNFGIQSSCITPYDALMEWPSSRKHEFNKILCIPPFGTKIQAGTKKNKNVLSENFILHSALSYLEDGGVFVGIFPRRSLCTNFIFSNELQYLQAVITLPSRSTISNDNLVMLVFKKSKLLHNNVLLIDATQEFVDINDKFKRFDKLNYESVWQLFESFEKVDAVHKDGRISDNAISVSREEIEENNYLLNPRLYLIRNNLLSQNGSKTQVVPLASVTRECKTKGKTSEISRVYVSIDELVHESTQKPQVKNVTGTTIINTSCLFFPLRKHEIGEVGAKFIKTVNRRMYIDPTKIFALGVDNDQIGRYLQEEFHKSYIKEQIANLKFCNTTRALRTEDIKLIWVITPTDFSEYGRLTSESVVSRSIEETENARKVYEELARKEHDEYVKNIHMRKHAIGQILNDLCPCFDVLDTLRQRENGVLMDNMIVSKRSGKTVAASFTEIKHALNRIEDMVRSFTDEIVYGEESTIDIRNFIESYVSHHITNNYIIETNLNPIVVDNIETGFSGVIIDFILFSETDLSQILDNILSNASKYGFTDENRKNYKVVVSVTNDENSIILRIGNNGEPIPNDFNLEKVFAWKQTTGKGSGMGGYQIKRIVEHFGGEVDIKTYDNDPDGITVEYIIKLKTFDII